MKKLYIKIKNCSYYTNNSDGTERARCKIETIRNEVVYQVVSTDSTKLINSIIVTNLELSSYNEDTKSLIIGNGIVFIPTMIKDDLVNILNHYLFNVNISN